MLFLHLGSAFLWELDKGSALNEIGHCFRAVGPSTYSNIAIVKVQYSIQYEANEMRGRGLKMPHKAQVIN